jgi:hypothetical protein
MSRLRPHDLETLEDDQVPDLVEASRIVPVGAVEEAPVPTRLRQRLVGHLGTVPEALDGHQ